MRSRFGLLALGASLTIALAYTARAPLGQSPGALTGVVTSAGEGPMEGVLISAKRVGSSITTTVVSDDAGRYRFPRERLEPGQYTIRIRAVGYDLERTVTVDVKPQETVTADLALGKARDVAAQLTNTEWLASFPGTDEQKASVRGCAHCHTLELVARSRHDASEFVSVIERMAGYPPLAFPLMPQRTPAPRIGGGPVSAEQQRAASKRLAEYLSTLNLSAGPQWSYAFKTLPRPRGAATRVIYTEYDLPKRTRQPHDVIVDASGDAWYASFGEQILGKLDPRTGKTTEYDDPGAEAQCPEGHSGHALR